MKSLLKCLGQVVGFFRALPIFLQYALASAILGKARAFSHASERLARIPGLLGIYTRQAFFRQAAGGVGSDVHFGYMSLLSKPEITIGQRVYIGRFCTLGHAKLGDDVMLADGVQILSGRHQHGSTTAAGEPLRDNPQQFTQVTIGRGAWIGANAVVMADVGENAIVAAGAVVVKPVPAGAKVAGVPARPLLAAHERAA